MAVMISEVYDALRELGVSEEKARRAAEAVAVQEPRLTGIETRLNTIDARLTAVEARLNFMQWQIGIVAALQIAILVKVFVH
jgi:hypothetical protein